MVKITVSILTKNDKETILKLNNTNLDYFHIDVMDGKFVNEINFPISKIEKIKEYVNKPLDIHLMVEKPNDYLDKLPFSKIEYITIHHEVLNNDLTILDKIKSYGIKCGISVKPNTDIKDIFYLLDKIDLILIMSVEPGYGGQEFLVSSLDKVRLLKSEIIKRHSKAIIPIDGGINEKNAKSCIDAGCDMLVSGSYIVSNEDFQTAIDSLFKV